MVKKNSKYFKSSSISPVAFQRKLDIAERKIQSLKVSFDHKYQALENFLTLIVNFASHDIKNTLHNLDGMISTLKPDLIKDEQIHDMQMCVDHIRATLIKFNDFSIANQEKEFELQKLFQNLEILHRPYFKADKVEFNIEYCDIQKDLKVFQDMQLLLFMFNNMVINSLSALKKAEIKKIRIKLNIDSENIIVLFCDTGEGIIEENRNKVFEAYFSTREGGTGVGLTHVKFVVEQLLKSKITLEDVTFDDFVTIFKIIIPIKSNETQNIID